MDFCVLDQEELEIDKEVNNDDSINPFITFIDAEKFQEYLESPLYNDPFFNDVSKIELFPVPDVYELISEQDKNNVNLR